MFSESSCQIILHTFPELTSSNTDIFRTTGKQYHTLFQSLHQIIPTFSEGYCQTILRTFPYQAIREFLLNLNIVKSFFRVHTTQFETFRELLTSNIVFFRAHIKQYSNFHRFITKQ